MGNFLKNVFSVVVGLFVFLFISFLGLLFIISLIASDGDLGIKSDSVLKLKLDREIVERESEKLFSAGSLLPAGSSIGLIDLKEAIAQAKTDDKIKGIYLELSTVQGGFASLEEIRNALLDFKKSKKFVVAYGESYSEGAYYLASVADKIFLPSSGVVEFNGLESELVFFKGTLEKLDIKVEVFKVGSFKSAVEPFLLDKMSDANRQQMKSFMNSIYDTYLENVAASRQIDLNRLRVISDSMLIHNGEDALKYKLVTDLDYYDKVEAFIRSKTGQKKEDKINFVSYSDILDNIEELELSDSRVAVIVANGEILSGKGNDEIIGSETIAAQIRKARESEKVKAIVLRVNSPGGSALASDVIWNEVVLTKGVKPIIASMSDVAASGGYYISMACDTIVAQPTTITGSIGVFGLVLNVEAFLKGKLGITTDREKTGKFSDIGSPTRTLTAYEKQMIQKEVEQIYEDFTSKAAQGRKMPQEELKKYAEGRVWSGKEALNIKLVDTLGGLEDAIKIAARKAGLKEKYDVVYWPEQKNLYWKQLLSGMGDEDAKVESVLKKELGFLYPYVRSARDLENLNGIQARMPYKLIVK
jgi:protease IV